MRSTFKRLLTITAAMVAVMVLAPSVPAQAAATVYNQKNLWLTDDPHVHMGISNQVKRIYLGAGNYGWWPYVKPNVMVPVSGECGGRVVYLNAGWYYWGYHLIPMEGYYAQELFIEPDGPGKDAVMTCNWKVEFTNEYTVGSGLDPHF